MSVTAERLMVEVQADVRQALTKLDQVERKAATSSSRVGKMARSMGLAFGGAAIVSGVKKTISLAMDFDKTMRQVGVQTELSGAKLEKMGQLAMKMGKDTVFSAQDASGAMLELAKGGLTAADIRAGALQQTLTLAAAGGLDLANAATYITQGMNTFGLKAKDATKITTALAGGANASTASVESMGMALSQAGAGAVNAGMNIQETVAALAAFDNAGIKGSDAGTSLKTMLASLVPTTNKARGAMTRYGLEFVKRNGDFKTMAQVAGELKEGLGDLGQAERVRAMKAIFGSDATRAATVLMKEGARGVRDYTKATTDRRKAQEMADSAMKGASGAWEDFTGSVETAAIQVGRKLLPAFTTAAKAGGEFIDTVMGWGPEVEESFGWTIDAAKNLVGAFKPLVELVKGAAGFWADLPGPVKEVGVQMGLAALIVPRLTAALTTMSATAVASVTTTVAKVRQLGAEMTYTATRTQRLQMAATRMGGALQMAAGIGGMVALQQGAERSNKALSVMGSTLTGAAFGAAVGSVIPGLGTGLGAVAGGAVGAASGLWKAGKASEYVATQAEVARSRSLDFAASLDQVTGAATRETRALVLAAAQKDGILGMTTRLGVSTRDLIGATLGNAGAAKRLGEAYRANSQLLPGDEQATLNTWLRHNTNAFRDQSQQVRDNHRDLSTWKQALKGLPPKVQTAVKALGVNASTREVKALKRQYDLNPRQVRTIVKAIGTELVVKRVKGVWKVMKDGEKIKPNVSPWVDAYLTGMDRVSGKAKTTNRDLEGLGKKRVVPKADLDDAKARSKNQGLRLLLDGLGKLRPTPQATLKDFATPGINAVSSRLTALNGRSATVTTYHRTVSVGGGVRRASGGPIVGPGGPRSDSIPAMLSNGEYVMDAETYGRAGPLIRAIHAAKGRVLGFASGGEVGGASGGKGKGPKVWGVDIVKDLVRGLRDGLKPTKKTMDSLANVVRRNMDGKRQTQWLKVLNQREKKLTGMWRRHAQITEKLEKANNRLANLRETRSAFVESTRAGMASQATVLNAGNTAGHIANSLGVQVGKVKAFAGMLKKLRRMGYSQAILTQIAEAGVEGGWQAATALVNATDTERASIQESFNTINSVATNTAQKLGSQMFDSGIKAAQGLVKGLKNRRKDVEDTIRQIALAMRNNLRRALGLPAQGGGGKGGGGGRDGGRDRDRGRDRGGDRGGANRRGIAAGYSAKGLKPGALNGGTRAGAGVSFNFTTVNPQAEPQSRTTNKALARVATLGLV